MKPDPHPSLRTRPSLLLRVRDWNDQSSWNEFHRLYRRLILGVARRAGLSHADAEEVAQDVFARVAETIETFESDPNRGTFRAWLMQLTRWRITDKFRTLPKNQHVSVRRSDETLRGTATIARVPDSREVDEIWEVEWRQHLLESACDRIARRVEARHFQIFDLYVVRQWPVAKVAKELGVSHASVYVVGHRLKKQLKAEVAKLQEQLD